MDKKLVAFDMDGTLLKSDTTCIPAYQEALREIGMPVLPAEEIVKVFGENAKNIARIIGLGDDDKLAKRYFDILEPLEVKHINEHGELFPGVRDCMEKLHADGVELAICSLGTMPYLSAIVDHFGLEPLLTYNVGDAHVKSKVELLKWLIDKSGATPQNVVMIGDRIHDREAAEQNETHFIGCAYGFQPWELEGSERVVESGTEIYAAVSEMLDLLTY